MSLFLFQLNFYITPIIIKREQIIMKIIPVVLAVFMIGCAQQSLLTGGQKDVSPPIKNLDKSPNRIYDTLFNENILTFYFNENIQYLKSKSSLIINPPIKNILVKSEKKKLEIKWEDSLIANTTYTFLFNESIADITEKNKIPVFKHVFSTGGAIDTGEVKGTIIQYPELIASDQLLVQLKNIKNGKLIYQNLSNEKGEFELTNIKKGNYRIIAFKDENNNFSLDTTTEIQAFNINPISIKDSVPPVNLLSFPPEKKCKIEKSTLDPLGGLTIEFNKEVDSCIITNTQKSFIYSSDYYQKKHTFYLNDTSKNHFLIIKSASNNFQDTILVSVDNKKTKNKPKLTYKEKSISNITKPKAYTLEFNQFIEKLNTNFITLIKDSTPVLYEYSLSNNELIIIPEDESGDFQLTFLPKSITGIKHEKKDTSIVNFSIKSTNELGELELKLQSKDTNDIIFQLMKNNEIVFEGNHNTGQLDTLFNRCGLGDYQLKIIIDSDGNKKWTTGNIINSKFPEKIIPYNEIITLKKNWRTSILWEY